MEKDLESKEKTVHKVSGEYIHRSSCGLLRTIEKESSLFSTRYLHLGDVTVRVLVYDRNLDAHITHELSFIIDDNIPDKFDYSIVVWLKISGNSDRVVGYDEKEKCFYYGFPDSNPEQLASEGHIFIRQFYRMFKDSDDSSLVHGACVGVGDNGALLCARGNGGKSTLTVLALLKGFDFVSDDYMVIRGGGKDGKLYADPIYSIITLSPTMYNEMYTELEGTRFISNNWDKSKYIISVANLHSRFRIHYPVKVCMLPEIVSDPQPSIMICTSAEKGRAITSMVHSTISQMRDCFDTANTLKMIGLLKNQKFYKIRLCRDIRSNVECLRHFLAGLK